MKKYILIFCLFFSSFIHSQQHVYRSLNDTSLSRLNIGIEVGVFQGLILEHNNGPEILNSFPLPSFVLSLGYPIYFNKNWVLSFAASAGYAPINLTYRISDLQDHTIYNSNGDQHDFELNEIDAVYLGTGFVNLNISVLKYLEFNKTLVVGGGFSIARGVRDFSSGGSFGQNEITLGSEEFSYPIFESFIDEDTISLPWKPVVQFRAGKKLGNNIEAYVNINYSLKPWFSGAYYFYNLGFSSNGKYQKRISYIGLQVIYSLPLNKKKNER